LRESCPRARIIAGKRKEFQKFFGEEKILSSG
jgi:hypothetical protein